jgi:hypothetical protein
MTSLNNIHLDELELGPIESDTLEVAYARARAARAAFEVARHEVQQATAAYDRCRERACETFERYQDLLAVKGGAA